VHPALPPPGILFNENLASEILPIWRQGLMIRFLGDRPLGFRNVKQTDYC